MVKIIISAGKKGGNISVVKDGEIIAGHLMAYAIVDGWESGWEFEIK